MDKKEFARRHGPISVKLRLLGKEYREVGLQTINNEDDAIRVRNEFIRVANKFIELSNATNSIPAPKGYEKDVQKMREYFSEYVNLIKEKSEKFGIEVMKSGELDRLRAKEGAASKRYHDFIVELTNKMFSE